MKKINTLLLAVCCLFVSIFSVTAQNYGTVQLPTPDNVSPLFLGSFTDSKIYYGANPNAGRNKPVLVFVHGFIDLANLWFAPGNDMYDQAYNSGYRTAFVAMTRGEGMWENGALLAPMLEDIAAHYGEQEVVIVAHSNGGKASEVAMFHHNKSHLVNRVITLGTPYFGTEVADLAETFWFRWLVNFVGLGGGTSTSTTYYMGGVARPYFDNLPNNEPQKFFHLGAWGYNNGTTITAPTMLVTGLLLNANGSGAAAGGNDGVTPYWSSTRPGGFKVWDPGYGNPVSRFDHIDITFDYVVWNTIEPYFTGPLATPRNSGTQQPIANHKAVINSAAQYLSTKANQTTFTVEEGVETMEMSILHLAPTATFQAQSQTTGEIINLDSRARKGEGDVYMSTMIVNNLAAGQYTLISEVDFAAVLHSEGGINMQYSTDLTNEKLAYETGETVNLQVELTNTELNLNNTDVTAIITRTLDANNQAVEENYTIVTLENGAYNQFTASLENLEAGVYNVMVHAAGSQVTKSLVSGFAVNAPKTIETGHVTTQKPYLAALPNVIETSTTIDFEIQTEDKSYLRLYDTYGRLVQETQVADFGIGQHQMTWELGSQLSTGIYFIEFQNGDNRNTIKVTKR